MFKFFVNNEQKDESMENQERTQLTAPQFIALIIFMIFIYFIGRYYTLKWNNCPVTFYEMTFGNCGKLL